MDWQMQLQLLGYGLFAGVLGGLLGIGGGIIYVLILPAALTSLGVQPNEIVAFTVANSLFATIFTTLSGNIRQARSNNFYARPILIISAVGIVTSILLLHFFVNSLYYSATTFNIIFLCLLGYMMVRLILKVMEKPGASGEAEGEEASVSSLLLTGVGAGAISPLTGLGGGVFIVPLLHSILHYPIRKANGISLGVIGLTALASSIFNMGGHPASQVHSWQVGFIVFPVALALSVGGMIGSFFGVEIGHKMQPRHITLLFAGFLLFVFIKKLLEVV